MQAVAFYSYAVIYNRYVYLITPLNFLLAQQRDNVSPPISFRGC